MPMRSVSKYNSPIDKIVSSLETPQQLKEAIKRILEGCSNTKDPNFLLYYRIQTQELAKKFAVFVNDYSPEEIIYILRLVSKISNLTDPDPTDPNIDYNPLDLFIIEAFKSHRPPSEFALLKEINKTCEPNDKEALEIKQKIVSLSLKESTETELDPKINHLKRKLPKSDVTDECSGCKADKKDPVTAKVNTQENADAVPDPKEPRSAEGIESSNNPNSVPTEENADSLLYLNKLLNSYGILPDDQVPNDGILLADQTSNNELSNLDDIPSNDMLYLMGDNKEHCVWEDNCE